jgi:hypothetical protein
MKRHPSEAELALLAGGDCGVVSRFFLNRHLRQCEQCLDTMAEFRMLRSEIAERAGLEPEISEFDWNRLASEMRANIHLGLEAGACVDGAGPVRIWNPRLAAAFASLLLLMGAGLALRVHPAAPAAQVVKAAEPVVESTGSGLEVRTGGSSLTLLNHHGSVADQTVSAQGVIRARYIDAGGVTINNVYLE